MRTAEEHVTTNLQAVGAFANHIPIPTLPASPYLVELYFEAWRLASEHLAAGTIENGFAARYMDEGFDGQIYQWDSCFMTLFAIYAGEAFGKMAALDNFYRLQRSDGWISRVYREAEGSFPHPPSDEEPMLNPPLFAYVEWRYLQLTGDHSRLLRVIAVLDKYYRWIEANAAAEGEADGMFYTTLLGSGMDNAPRGAAGRGGWVDQTAQMRLFAHSMRLLAKAAGLDEIARRYAEASARLKEVIEQKLWSNHEGFYFDLAPDGSFIKRFTLAGVWPMFAGVTGEQRLSRIIRKLRDPEKFHRPYPFSTLSADDPDFSSRGFYWRGAVWAPTNYVAIRALSENGEHEFAVQAAARHLQQMYAVWKNFLPDTSLIAPDQRDGEYATLWECYSSEEQAPATRWDDRYYARQDFVGWSGLGPINLLLEVIIGLEPDAPAGQLSWKLYGKQTIGVENYRFGDNVVTLLAERTTETLDTFRISVRAKKEFTLRIERQRGILRRHMAAGFSTFEF